jgi:hypothetical protein
MSARCCKQWGGKEIAMAMAGVDDQCEDGFTSPPIGVAFLEQWPICLTEKRQGLIADAVTGVHQAKNLIHGGEQNQFKWAVAGTLSCANKFKRQPTMHAEM